MRMVSPHLVSLIPALRLINDPPFPVRTLPTRQLSEEEANEIEVTWEDQQSINAFSRLNSTFSDVAEDLRVRKEEREALDDLAMELELADEDETVLYKIADTFVSLPHAEAMERLEKEQQQADEEIEGLQGRLDGFEDEMKSLKVKLYAKFGDNISKFHSTREGSWSMR